MTDLATPTESPSRSPLATEVARRRTFAIISHPDAGKTTLTEKLLLFGDPAGFARIACIGLIVAGIVGLKLAT